MTPAPVTLDDVAALLAAGRVAEARSLACELCQGDPANARAWFLAGAAAHAAGDLPAALHDFDRCLRLWPDDLQALLAAASVRAALGRTADALAVMACAVALAPQDAATLRNRGVLLLRSGRIEAAAEDFRRVTEITPDDVLAHFHLAEALLAADRYAEAVAAGGAALNRVPGHVGALIDTGLALAMLRRFDEAEELFSRAWLRSPQAAQQHVTHALGRQGGRMVLGIPPAREIYVARQLERQRQCDWRERQALVGEMRALVQDYEARGQATFDMAIAFGALGLPLSQGEQTEAARGVARRIGRGPPLPEAARRRPSRSGRTLRLGYLSPDFRDHPAAQCHWRHLAAHDRRQYAVFAYSLHPGDGSALRQAIEASVDVFRDVSAMDDLAVARQIAADGIDILVDLAGFTDFSRPAILALRPAPVVASYMGMPGSLGAPFIDYRITDRVATPPALEPAWPERLAFLPDTCFMANDRETIADARPDRAQCGLPADAFVFCCFNNAFKIEPEAFAIWLDLLNAVPDSVLWLLDGGEAMQRHLHRAAAARSIGAERLIFAPRMRRDLHLARLAAADLFLDTFCCNAHTTAAESLWAGLPVLTLLGRTMASRLGGSVVGAAGLPELVVESADEYRAMALHLVRNPDALAALRSRLANRHGDRLFATETRVRDLEWAFDAMWHRHEAGLPPESFEVPAVRPGRK